MTPRVVFDTNIIVSAALDVRPQSFAGRPSLCLRLAFSGFAIMVVSAELLAEYEEVLRRPKFGLPVRRVSAFLTLLRKNSELVESVHLPARVVRDPDDAHVLGTAVAGDAGFLVTGNIKDFPTTYRGVRVVSPADFLTLVVTAME